MGRHCLRRSEVNEAQVDGGAMVLTRRSKLFVEEMVCQLVRGSVVEHIQGIQTAARTNENPNRNSTTYDSRSFLRPRWVMLPGNSCEFSMQGEAFRCYAQLLFF